VIYVARADVVRDLGAWGEEYEIASGEDVDLCFKVWVNDLDIVYDQRVLVQHVGKGSASLLPNWRELWSKNRRRFLDKWIQGADVPRLDTCPPERFARNRETAKGVAQWMERYFSTRDRLEATPLVRVREARRRLVESTLVGWRRVRPHVPARVAEVVGNVGRRLR
jgi:hypothetical protein